MKAKEDRIISLHVYSKIHNAHPPIWKARDEFDQSNSFPLIMHISTGASPDLMDTAENLYDRGGGVYGGRETSF